MERNPAMTRRRILNDPLPDPDLADDPWMKAFLEGGPIARGERLADGSPGPNKPQQPPKRRSGATPHAKLVKAVVRALRERWPAAHVERRQVGMATYKARDGQFRRFGFGVRGEADVRVLLKGKAIALECKCEATGDSQKPAQKRWQARWERSADRAYAVVWSAEDAIEAVCRAVGELAV
jgi:hypothetical protein